MALRQYAALEQGPTVNLIQCLFSASLMLLLSWVCIGKKAL